MQVTYNQLIRELSGKVNSRKACERNKPYIPCYEIKKDLGLRNSSPIGEKMNDDLVVSERQKHNGMHWSKNGSVELATITALKKNKEH